MTNKNLPAQNQRETNRFSGIVIGKLIYQANATELAKAHSNAIQTLLNLVLPKEVKQKFIDTIKKRTGFDFH